MSAYNFKNVCSEYKYYIHTQILLEQTIVVIILSIAIFFMYYLCDIYKAIYLIMKKNCLKVL